MNNQISMIDAAYSIVKESKKPITLDALLKSVQKKLELTDEELIQRRSKFYTNLSLDSRFVNLGHHGWDLSIRHDFATVHEEVKDLDAEGETNILDLVDEEELDESEQDEENENSNDSLTEQDDDLFIPSEEGE